MNRAKMWPSTEVCQLAARSTLLTLMVPGESELLPRRTGTLQSCANVLDNTAGIPVLFVSSADCRKRTLSWNRSVKLTIQAERQGLWIVAWRAIPAASLRTRFSLRTLSSDISIGS